MPTDGEALGKLRLMGVDKGEGATPLLKKRGQKALERPVIELLLRSTQTEEAICGKNLPPSQMLPGLFSESRKERG